ncbi:MAG: RtcB family protein [Pseudomonadota bacterium]
MSDEPLSRAYNGRDLIEWGFEPAKWFPEAIAAANRLAAEGAREAEIRAAVAGLAPPPPPPTLPLRDQDAVSFHRNIEAETPAEAANVEAVEATMRELMRTPTVVAGAVMPDACPAGGLGTIPVGGVVATENAIHPGFHSADICCSMAFSLLGDVDPTAVLDAAERLTHFGGGGRAAGEQIRPPESVMARFDANPLLKSQQGAAVAHFATQGDGNHFLFVGRLRSNGRIAMVTHHGSRKPGALLYKAGMKIAEAHRAKRAPEVLKQNAWIEADSAEGETYWDALQAIRAWTKANHFAIHDRVISALGLAGPEERFWNEHNFVFRRGDRFYHGKGATPAWADFAEDSVGLTLIPLNMAEPVLITRGLDAANALGFAPHGAGRNRSRGAHMKSLAGRSEAEVLRAETHGLDARFFCGIPDLPELPSAYKDAASVTAQIERFGLAEIVDQVDPIGSIMAGEWARPFRDKRNKPQRGGKRSL